DGERGDVLRGERGGAVAEEERLEPFAHLVDLLALGEGQARHPGAGVGDDAHESLVLELAQRLAHRDTARAVPGGDILLADAGARRVDAGDDVRADGVGDAGAGVTVARTRRGSGHCFSFTPRVGRGATGVYRHRPRRP